MLKVYGVVVRKQNEWSIHVELRKRRLVIIPIIKKEQSLTINSVFSLAKYDRLN